MRFAIRVRLLGPPAELKSNALTARSSDVASLRQGTRSHTSPILMAMKSNSGTSDSTRADHGHRRTNDQKPRRAMASGDRRRGRRYGPGPHVRGRRIPHGGQTANEGAQYIREGAAKAS